MLSQKIQMCSNANTTGTICSKKQESKPKNQSNTTKTVIAASAVLGSAVLAMAGRKGLFTQLGKLLDESLPVVKEKASDVCKKVGKEVEKVYKDISGQTAKEEVERKRAEEFARQQAERIRLEREARIAEAKRAEEMKKLAEQRRLEFEVKEAERKLKLAEESKLRAAKLEGERAYYCGRNNIYDRFKSLLNPEDTIATSVHRECTLESFIPEWNKQIEALKKEKYKEFGRNIYDYYEKIKGVSPKELFEIVPQEFEKAEAKGAVFAIDDALKFLQAGKIKSYQEDFIWKNGNLLYSEIVHRYREYNKFLDEVITELKSASPNEGEKMSAVVRKAINKVENKRIEFLNSRKNIYESALSSHSEQLKPIKDRLVYTEEVYHPEIPQLSRQDKQELADELNQLCDLKGDRMLTADSPFAAMFESWRGKYISMPFSLINQKAEKAILESMPKYSPAQRFQNPNDGFKYEPLYRFMHVNDLEGFLKQFDEIGGVYKPNRLQSCTMQKYYGESWWAGNFLQYGFADWSNQYNIKLVIHPKGPVSKAAEIGEGKYGTNEAIYPADSKFRILGKVKRKVTPEEIKAKLGGNPQFDDFERIEIHLQEM